MIIPSEKVAQRVAKTANAQAQGEAAIASFKMIAEDTVRCNYESMENPKYEEKESAMEGEA